MGINMDMSIMVNFSLKNFIKTTNVRNFSSLFWLYEVYTIHQRELVLGRKPRCHGLEHTFRLLFKDNEED